MLGKEMADYNATLEAGSQRITGAGSGDDYL
jgi:hypothetical protein